MFLYTIRDQKFRTREKLYWYFGYKAKGKEKAEFIQLEAGHGYSQQQILKLTEFIQLPKR
jgi:phage-related protein